MKKILILDDEEDILEITELILNKEYEVHTLSELHDPVEIVKNIKPDLVLLDVNIPTIGGEKAIKMLRQKPETKDVKVVLFSASNDLPELKESFGADGYIMKPFKINQLKKIIRSQLQE